jgi:hypothetical protein
VLTWNIKSPVRGTLPRFLLPGIRIVRDVYIESRLRDFLFNDGF